MLPRKSNKEGQHVPNESHVENEHGKELLGKSCDVEQCTNSLCVSDHVGQAGTLRGRLNKAGLSRGCGSSRTQRSRPGAALRIQAKKHDCNARSRSHNMFKAHT